MRWIIGDIHGMLRPLEKLLSAIDRADPARELLFVGDYVNRGPDSRGVIELLLPLAGARFIRGNHDDIFDHVLGGTSYCAPPGEDDRIAAFRWFMQHGLDKTFYSYGVARRELGQVLRRPSGKMLNDLAQAVPPAHRQFIARLLPAIEENDLFVAHAKWDIHLPIGNMQTLLASSPSMRHTLLWGRYGVGELASSKTWEKRGYFGHTTVDHYQQSPQWLPVAGEKIMLLDTAAALAADGRLTAFCHETGKIIQADAEGRLLPD